MSIPILSVKDDKGNIIPIPAIKGDKGDAYVLTEADKEEIANMVNLPIDQTYNPKSENAQSGKAVAEAVEWIVLTDTTLDETNANVRVVSIELDKEKVNACRQFFFQLQFTTQAELQSSNIQVSLVTPYSHSVLTYVLQQHTISANKQAKAVAFSIRDEQCFYSICKKLIAAVEFNSFYETYSTISYNYDENAEVIKLRVAFNEGNTFPAGTHIRLVGRR